MGWLPDLLVEAATRNRRRPVAGPYRSQSSNPRIRAAATGREHRRVVANPFDALDIPDALEVPDLTDPADFHPVPQVAAPDFTGMFKLPRRLEDPYTAFDMARFHGQMPAPVLRREWKRDYGPGVYKQVQDAAMEYIGAHEDLGEPADLTNLIVGAATLGGGLYLRGALAGGEAAAGAATGASAGGRAAEAARIAGKVLTLPLKHPVATSGAPLAAQAPVAVGKGDPGEFKKALEGTGVLAQALGGAGGAVRKVAPGVAGNTLADLLSLPAQVLPSAYFTGKAGMKAIGGDPSEAEGLLREYGETSAIPALLQGDFGEAASRAEEHPLYTALEGLALKSAVGRGAGAVGRRLKIPGTEFEMRPDLVAYGDVARRQGPYSGDLITRFFQRRADERRPRGPDGEVLLRPREASRHLRGALDREIFAGEQVRRGNQRQVAHELNEARPSDPAQADVVAHAIQGIARNPDRAIFDLQSYRDDLLAQQPNLTASELTANRRQVEAIDAALANPNPDAIYGAVRTFVEQQKPITEGLVDRGLLDADQARKAIAIPYARTHMDAGYGLSRADEAEVAQVKEAMKQKGLSAQERGQLLGRLSSLRAKAQTLDRKGDPLDIDAIEAHMREVGLEPADFGFVTQRPAPAHGPSSFFRPPSERPSMARQRRTGEATAQGTFDSSWDSVLHQLIHDRSILDQTRNFEAVPDRFGMRAPDGRAFADWGEGKRAAEFPEDFGMQLPDIPGGWVPFRLSPWLAKKAEIEASAHLGQNHALEADQGQMIENFSADAVKNALEPGDGPVVLMPKIVTDRMRQHFQEIYPAEKATQAITGAFKGAVLPTSPKWAAGNALDNYVVRSFSTGITPRDMLTGKRFAALFKNVLSPEEQARALESIVPGGLYGSYARVQPYRAMDQFVGTKIEPLARAAHAVLTAPGIRTAAELYRRYRDTVFELDSKYVEQTPQYGQLAKSARQELNMTRRQFRNAVAAQDAVVTDFIKGFRNPENIDHFARQVEDVFGNWGKNSPEARRFLTTWAPFWMWGRSAIKFAFVTLPRDHPMLTGLIAASEQMTREEREKFGLDFAGKEPLPDFLQGGIPSSDGGVTALGGLTTFGTFNDLPQFLASVPAPQFSSLVLGGLGLDWKGDKLVDKDGRPASQTEKVKAAMFGTLDAYIPFLNVGRAITDHGAGGLSPFRTYPESTVDYLRGLHNTQQIQVPITEGDGGGGEEANPFDAVDGALGTENPFDALDP